MESRAPNQSSRSSASPTSSRSSSPEPDPMIAVVARLKELAHQASAARVPYPDDTSDHYQTFSRAVFNLLSTDLALFTFAQIVDGLPTTHVAWDRRLPGISDDDHPIEGHPSLCPGVMERTREIRDQVNLSILLFDPLLIRAYRRAALGSQAFKVRLIELAAATMHQLGALLFKLDACMHQGGRQDVERVGQYQEPPLEPGLYVPRPRVTLFSHHGYLAHDVYPEGVADVVGYWAEDRILGGVAVFDRAAEERAPQEPPNVYFNACREHVTYRYFQLRDEQQQAMVDFLLAEDASRAQSPLPIIGDLNNRVRVDAHKAILHRRIYRDIWERVPPTPEQASFLDRRPQNGFDYPEHRDLLKSVNRTLGIQPPPRESREQDSGRAGPDDAKDAGSSGTGPTSGQSKDD